MYSECWCLHSSGCFNFVINNICKLSCACVCHYWDCTCISVFITRGGSRICRRGVPWRARSSSLQCAAKKVSPKAVCHFLSNHLEFLRETLRLLPVHTHIKMPSGIWLPSICAKLQTFLYDHLVIFAHSKISVRKRPLTEINNQVTLLMTSKRRKLRKQ